jgi:hypothetical protein
MLRPDPSPCDNPLPAIRVRGRTTDALTVPTEAGESVTIPSLTLELDRVPGIGRAQIVQRRPTTLRVRLRPAAGVDPELVWKAALGELRGLLAAHALSHVAIERGEEPPQPSLGGKYRQVIPLSP